MVVPRERPHDLVARIGTIHEALGAAESEEGFEPTKRYLDAVKTWAGSIQTWCKTAEVAKALQADEGGVHESRLEMDRVLEALPADEAFQVRMALIRASRENAA